MVIGRLWMVVGALFLGGLLALSAGAVPQLSSAAEAQTGDTVAVKDCFGRSITLKREEYRMLRLHNEFRANRGIKRLCVHPKLQRAAREHSRDMLEKDYFSHLSRGGKEDPGERLHRYGYDWSAYGENIGWGQGTLASPGDIFRKWTKAAGSDPHRRTVISKRYREVGLGVAHGHFDPGPGGPFPDASIWTVDFGSRG